MIKAVLWYNYVLYKELRLGKYKAIFKYFYDKKYRQDINKLCTLLKDKEKRKPIIEQIYLKDIGFSHSITYQNTVESVKSALYAGKEIPLFTVLRINNLSNKYMVINGNHRLMAYKEVYKNDNNIKVVAKILY